MHQPAFLAHPSGGLLYHLRAWRFRRTLWRVFLDQVEAWLRAWPCPGHRLILVGPSAGYSLPRAFLAGFDDIVAIEPDPIARRLLRWRFHDLPITFEHAPFEIARVSREPSDSTWLFCNLLGQAWTPLPAATWRRELDTALRGRRWASYHEIASSTQTPTLSGPLFHERCPGFDGLVSQFWRQSVLTVEDHETLGLAPERSREYAIWRFMPGRHHLIEWLRG
jgi:hypothetical protein